MRANEKSRAEISRRLSPQWRLYDQTIAALSDDDLLDLDHLHKIVFSTQPALWQRPFPNASRDLAIGNIPLLSQLSTSEGNDLDRKRDLMAETYRPFTKNEVASIRLTLRQDFKPEPEDFSGYPMGELIATSQAGDKLAHAYANPPPAYPERRAQTPDTTPKDLLRKTDWMARVTEDKDIWARDVAQSMADFEKIRSKSHPAKAVAQWMIEVARASDCNLICPVFDRANWLNAFILPLDSRQSALNAFGGMLRLQWTINAGWIQFQSKHWQFDRQRTIPADVLFWIKDRLLMDDYSFDALADCSLKLSDRQMSSPLMSQFLRDSFWTVQDRTDRGAKLLRFWGSTPKAMKDVLLAGQSVRFGDLTPEQKSHLTEFVYRQEDRNYEVRIFSVGNDNLEEKDLSWLRANWPGFEKSRDYQSDAEPTQNLPNGIPNSALVTIHASEGKALMVSNASGWTMGMSEQMAVTGGYYKPDSEFQAIPAKESRMYFGVSTSPESGYGYQINRIQHPKDAKPKPYSEFPEEIRNRLEKAYRARRGGG